MAFKELYTFTIDREQEVEKTHTRTSKKTGEKTTVTKNLKHKKNTKNTKNTKKQKKLFLFTIITNLKKLK